MVEWIAMPRLLQDRLKRQAGLSLLETVVALFVLLSAFVIVLSLFLRSTDYLVNVERKVFSVTFGETVIEDIRVWAKDYANYSSDWSAWQNVVLTGYSGYQGRATVRTPEVLNPGSRLELGKPVASRTIMGDSFRDVTLVVSFNGSEQLSLTTRVAEPDRGVQELIVRPLTGGTSLTPNTEASFQASLLDTNSAVIPDVSFSWSIEPISGNGAARPQQPDSSVGIVRNAYIGADGLTRIVPGTARVRAVARYRGRDYSGLFTPVDFLP